MAQLFYTRRDLKGVSFRHVFPDVEGPGGLTEEQFEKLMRKRDANQCAVM
jgi:hypothetical protein